MPAIGLRFHGNDTISRNAASVCALKCSSFFRRNCSGSRPMTAGWARVVTNAPQPHHDVVLPDRQARTHRLSPGAAGATHLSIIAQSGHPFVCFRSGGHYASRMAKSALRLVGIQIAVISFAVLFQELFAIRWMGQQVRALAYFPNLILIASFLGLGVGCIALSHRAIRHLWGPSLLALAFGAALLLSRTVITQESASEHLWLLPHSNDRRRPRR